MAGTSRSIHLIMKFVILSLLAAVALAQQQPQQAGSISTVPIAQPAFTSNVMNGQQQQQYSGIMGSSMPYNGMTNQMYPGMTGIPSQILPGMTGMTNQMYPGQSGQMLPGMSSQMLPGSIAGFPSTGMGSITGYPGSMPPGYPMGSTGNTARGYRYGGNSGMTGMTGQTGQTFPGMTGYPSAIGMGAAPFQTFPYGYPSTGMTGALPGMTSGIQGMQGIQFPGSNGGMIGGFPGSQISQQYPGMGMNTGAGSMGYPTQGRK